MKASEKIKGIVYAYNTGEEYDMVRELGVEWIRLNVSFPWTDKMFGTLSEQYLRDREEIRRTHARGFQVMPATPPLGGFTYDEALGKTCWHESFPDFVGKKGTEEFYENIRETMRFVCEDLGEDAGMYWQCMNEIDIPVFSNDYPDEIVADTARATAGSSAQTRTHAAGSTFRATMRTPCALPIGYTARDTASSIWESTSISAPSSPAMWTAGPA